MPNIFIEMNREKAQQQTQGTAQRWIELKELKKQTNITMLPNDALSIIFDHVKSANLKTYTSALPLVNKQWRAVRMQRNFQLQKNPLLLSVENLFKNFLSQASFGEKIKSFVTNGNMSRLTNLSRLLNRIGIDIANKSYFNILLQLSTIINNTNQVELREMLKTTMSLVFAELDFNQIQQYILDSMSRQSAVGAFPGENSRLSFVERLLLLLFYSNKATTSQKLFVLDMLITGFENNNFSALENYRIHKLGKMLDQLAADMMATGEDLTEGAKLLQRYEAVRPRFIRVEITPGPFII